MSNCWICSYIKNMELDFVPSTQQLLNQPSSSVNVQQYDNAISSDITLETIISDLTEFEFLKEIAIENHQINTEQLKGSDNKITGTIDQVIRKPSEQNTLTLNALNQTTNENFLISSNTNLLQQKTIIPITSVRRTSTGEIDYITKLDATYKDPFRSYYESLEGVAFARKPNETSRFRCLQCGKYIHNWESVCYHINTHQHRRPYQCSICQKNYANRSGLKRHAVLKHNLFQKKFKCVFCKKQFFSQEDFNRHNKLETSYLRFKGNKFIFPLENEPTFENDNENITEDLPVVIQKIIG